MANHRLQNKEFCQRLIAEQTIASVMTTFASEVVATLGLELFAKFTELYFFKFFRCRLEPLNLTEV